MIIRFFILLLFCGFFSAAAFAASDPLYLGENDGVNPNPHNLSNMSQAAIKAADTGDPNETRICVFCHTPHGATPDTPLWGRLDPLLMGSFPVYNSASTIQIRDTPATRALADYDNGGEYPNGASKLCLSCHDGATAIGTMANDVVIAMALNSDYITDAQMIFDDVSLGDTHPISFVYNSSVVTALGAGYNSISPYLDGRQRMQCTTCHDPHFNSDLADGARRAPYGAGGTYDLPFWRGAGTNEATEYDAICQACHTATPGTTPGDPHAI
ncbi:MAG: hypothetical protein P1P74_07990 [Desulfuromonadales bacterium]|nr:hypothetical protein [Desulfuromonadales bacterium]